ncbi:transcriptional regulator [Pseudomonas sp. NPDC088444]|uniref:transcriptional regulator n=1 Tax=Pseudomonas sp. NPDC088444 TaxID=3364456 RepID=UPI00384F34E1
MRKSEPNQRVQKNEKLQKSTSKTYTPNLLTVIESPLFSKLWPDYWTELEKGEFIAYLAANPDAGAVVPGSDGCRKIRWNTDGRGKSGAVRVIYTAQLANGALVALLIYGKGATENIPAHVLRKIAKEFNHAPD